MANQSRLVKILATVLVGLSLVGIFLKASTAHAQTVTSLSALGISPADVVNPDGTLNLQKNVAGVLDLRGWNVALDSRYGPILARGNAFPSIPTDSWAALPNKGLNSGVTALAVIGSDVYVGGAFTQTSDGTVTNLNNIAKFSGGTWSALPNNGLNSMVRSFAVIGSDLYVGGLFSQTSDGSVKDLNYIAKLSGGVWSALPNKGLNNIVTSIAVMGTDLYAGGFFSQTGDGTITNLNLIAKLSGGVWSALPHNGLGGGGSFGAVYALAANGSDLYVGGLFTRSADAAVTNLNYIAKLSGGVWSTLPNNGLNSSVFTIAISGADLYLGGNFTRTSDGSVKQLNYIAKLGGGGWTALSNKGLDARVFAIAVSGNDVYVGGEFSQTADGTVKNLNSVAKFSNGGWLALPNQGLNGRVDALSLDGSDLYVGGSGFTQSGDGAVKNLNHIAKLNTPPNDCLSKPTKPILNAPANNGTVTTTRPKLKWNAATCAETYNVAVKDVATGTKADSKTGIKKLQYTTIALTQSKTYQWFIQACNTYGCAKSKPWKFTVQ